MLKNLFRVSVVVFTGIVFLPSNAVAGVVKYEIVKDESIPKSLTGTPGDAVAGRKVALNRKKGNCLACHQISDMKEQPFHGEVGTSLDGVSGRMSVGEMRLRIVNPKVVNEDTIMPAFYQSEGFHRVLKKFKDKTVLSAQEVEDVIAYMLTLKE